MEWLLIILLSIIIFILNSKRSKAVKEVADTKEEFKDITDLNAEITKRENIIELQKKEEISLNTLIEDFKNKLNETENHIKLYDEDVDSLEYGVYKPIFNFATSEDFKNKLKEIEVQQKALIKEDKATHTSTNWSVGGSEAKGRKMIKEASKLMLRAFNGEVATLISKIKWDNAERSIEKLKKQHEQLNKLGKSNDLIITDIFKELKILELKLHHENSLKQHEEKEEQKRIREQMREEEKLRKEQEKKEKEARDEEARYLKALENAKKELVNKTGEELDQMNSKIAELEAQLSEAHSKLERTVSQAQLTKSGHVYVVSNIGSFGENVYKVGMTRRLEPLDRVKELSDASVPFDFDVHAMIYSQNAPELENQLHKLLNEKRVNKVNLRKEYFNIDINTLKEIVEKNTDSEVKLTLKAEAKEYRETQELIKRLTIINSN